jgi:4a-hydroxytetrahydrobiopterin dehydratase
MNFLNKIANLAEEQGHHPDVCISYNKLDFSLFTHAVGGLSENDFIMAAKIDELNIKPNEKH